MTYWVTSQVTNPALTNPPVPAPFLHSAPPFLPVSAPVWEDTDAGARDRATAQLYYDVEDPIARPLSLAADTYHDPVAPSTVYLNPRALRVQMGLRGTDMARINYGLPPIVDRAEREHCLSSYLGSLPSEAVPVVAIDKSVGPQYCTCNVDARRIFAAMPYSIYSIMVSATNAPVAQRVFEQYGLLAPGPPRKMLNRDSLCLCSYIGPALASAFVNFAMGYNDQRWTDAANPMLLLEYLDAVFAAQQVENAREAQFKHAMNSVLQANPGTAITASYSRPVVDEASYDEERLGRPQERDLTAYTTWRPFQLEHAYDATYERATGEHVRLDWRTPEERARIEFMRSLATPTLALRAPGGSRAAAGAAAAVFAFEDA